MFLNEEATSTTGAVMMALGVSRCFATGWRRMVAAALLTATMGAVGAQIFWPTEQLVTSQPDLIDAEYSQDRGQICWVDRSGNLWVGNINRQTGRFEPANGKGQLVDSNALTTGDVLGVTYNGPEWSYSFTGIQIVYTKFLPGRPHTMATGRLAVARQSADGSWSTQVLSPDLARNAPYASADPGDPRPRITYVDPSLLHYWREIDDPNSEEVIPGLPQGAKSVRFVQGSRAVVYSTPVSGVRQVFRYYLDTKVLEQLTFDDGDKDLQTVPWMWAAPDFGGVDVLMTVVNNNEMRFYRQLPAGGGTLTWQFFVRRLFKAGATVWSPEPMVYLGVSYVFTGLIVPPNTFSSEIWLVNLDRSAPMMRRLNDDTLLKGRMDPEMFVTDSGPFIYYNRFDSTKIPGQPFCPTCSEGVFRAHMGLPPPD